MDHKDSGRHQPKQPEAQAEVNRLKLKLVTRSAERRTKNVAEFGDAVGRSMSGSQG